ncbi:MAG TPA: MaoC family dehydratase N-terminal domain-containing protein [Candidatus Binataceae bacterium]|nr:MaoC family dehydratase N-terminal domain-containing protein [Candidatus Binataceae bacterium]
MADKSLIGKTAAPFTMPIEWGKVREFARAIRDRNPAYFDPELARKECGGIPIPPTFLMTSAFWQASSAQDAGAALDFGFDTRRILHGEQEFEFYQPIFVGDVLTGVTRVADLYEKEGGRGGKMTFAVVETEYTNQKGEKIALARFTLIETAGASKS